MTLSTEQNDSFKTSFTKIEKLEIIRPLLKKAWLFSCQQLPESDEDILLLYANWIEQLAAEGIYPLFWSKCFTLAINQRKSGTAAFQPHEVISAWRKYGRGIAKAFVDSLPDSALQLELVTVLPDVSNVVPEGRYWVLQTPQGKFSAVMDFLEIGDTVPSDDAIGRIKEQIERFNAGAPNKERAQLTRILIPQFSENED